MKNFDEYLELYQSEEDWYLKYVDERLKEIKRRYDKNESKRTIKRNK